MQYFTWSFHATSHEKGACDVIGVSVKRATSHESLRRNAANQILDVHAMIQFCKDSFPAIHFALITSDDLQSASPDLQKRFQLASMLKGTRSFHFFQSLGNSIFFVWVN